MLRRVFLFVVTGALFFVGMQFASVFFYAWAFDDFVRDEVKFAPLRESDDAEHLVQHIKRQAQFYSLTADDNKIRIEKHTDSGSTTLIADVNYAIPVDLFYFTYELRRHVRASTTY